MTILMSKPPRGPYHSRLNPDLLISNLNLGRIPIQLLFSISPTLTCRSFAMSKRKRSHETLQKPSIDSNDIMEPSCHQRRQLPTSTLDQYEKNLFRALRLARGFERQKLGRRQKVAKQAKDDAETARLNAEVAALKVR